MQLVVTGLSVPPCPRVSIGVLLFALFLLTGCSETAKKPVAKAPASPSRAEAPPAALTARADQPSQMSKLPAPQSSEVEEAVKRVFREAVVIDTSYKPSFIVGDFNGDLSQDIAVVLKPASDKLSELNEESPIWMLRDVAGSKPASPRLRIAANDKLLAIIHGFDAKGWRDQQATQTYLLKNAAGEGMQAHSARDFVATHKGKKLPELHGDVVAEEVGGKSGYLYYGAASYSWYDPKTFNGESEPRAFHMASSGAKK